MHPLITVIVPVYNVEKYFERCVTSIIEQTYDNLEIILVNDGSLDNSGVLCDEWAKKDSRIKAFHKKNGGLADARNFGTQRATGEYITYVDSDDYILPEFIEYLYTNLESHSADISCCNFMLVYDEQRETKFEENESLNCVKSLTGREACFESVINDKRGYYVTACFKLYKSSIIKNFPFPVGRLHEDAAVSHQILYTTPRIVVGDKKLYAYFQNSNSIMHVINPKRRIDEPWALSLRAEFYKQNNERELEIAEWDYVIKIYMIHAQTCNERLTKDAFSFARKHWFNGDLSRKTKFKFLLYAISPALYDKVIQIIAKGQ